jgi:hypothetical protein
LLEFRKKEADFTRNRSLNLVHTIGLVMSLTLTRNGNGYDIASQNYFRELSRCLDEEIDPVRRQSVSDARAKLGWEAFEYLLGEANLESSGLPKSLRFKRHVTRAVDGSSFFTPRTQDLLEHFSPRKTKAQEGETHYPYGLLVSAVNVFTMQPTAAVVTDYKQSERDGLRALIQKFGKGDLSLLDRGLGGAAVYREFEEAGQFFLHRAKTTGDRVASYLQEFLKSGKKDKTLKLCVKDKDSGDQSKFKIRLVLGPIDSEGKPIVFVTNLVGRKKYRRHEIIELYEKRWGIETMYGRVKNLLCLEKFHGRTYNGVMQEIFANLLALSLAAMAVTAVVDEDEMDTEAELPSFKNATEAVRRHLFDVVDRRIHGDSAKRLTKRLLAEVRDVIYPIRPGRSHPRVSRQPIKSWNLKKSAKIKAFKQQQIAAQFLQSKNCAASP